MTQTTGGSLILEAAGAMLRNRPMDDVAHGLQQIARVAIEHAGSNNARVTKIAEQKHVKSSQLLTYLLGLQMRMARRTRCALRRILRSYSQLLTIHIRSGGFSTSARIFLSF